MALLTRLCHRPVFGSMSSVSSSPGQPQLPWPTCSLQVVVPAFGSWSMDCEAISRVGRLHWYFPFRSGFMRGLSEAVVMSWCLLWVLSFTGRGFCCDGR